MQLQSVVKTSLAVRSTEFNYCLLGDGDMGRGLSGGSSHVAIIPLLGTGPQICVWLRSCFFHSLLNLATDGTAVIILYTCDQGQEESQTIDLIQDTM